MISKRRHSETHSHELETVWKTDLLKELTGPVADEDTLSYRVYNIIFNLSAQLMTIPCTKLLEAGINLLGGGEGEAQTL